jgi:hypothetical protein
MFDDATNPVLDVTVAEDSGTKPILSVLTAKGVYSINIYNDSQGFAGTLTQ